MPLKTTLLRVSGLLLCALVFAVPASATGGGGGADDGDGGSKSHEQKPDDSQKSDDSHSDDSHKSVKSNDDDSHKSVSSHKSDDDDDDDSGRSKAAQAKKHDKVKAATSVKVKVVSSHKSDDDNNKNDDAKKAKETEKASGSYKNTSSGTDLKKGMRHKHTICHATGSASNPYVRITPSVSGVFHGHLDHQDDRDIVPPFTYKGVAYSQNWDAAGQAIFAAGCKAPAAAVAPATQTTPPSTKHETGNCPTTVTSTEQVLVGIWHATGSYKDGQRKYVLISPSMKSAHWDRSKHEDDIPAYETRTVTRTVSGESCAAVTANPPSNPTPAAPAPQPVVQAQPVVPGAVPGATPAPGAVGVLPAAPETAAVPVGNVAGVATPAPAAQPKSTGGVLGAIASAPEAVADTATAATLPFTGFPLWIVALIGVALLLTGFLLRRRPTA